MLRVRADGPTMQTVRQCRREVRDGPTMQTGDVLMCMLVEMTGTAVRRRTMARRSRLYCRRLSGRAKRGYPPSRNPKPERNPAAKWAKPETQAPRKSETRNPNPGETPLRAEVQDRVRVAIERDPNKATALQRSGGDERVADGRPSDVLRDAAVLLVDAHREDRGLEVTLDVAGMGLARADVQ